MSKPPRILDLAFDVRDLPPTVMLIFIKMARLGNTTGQVYASQKTLAAACNCHVRTVRRALKLLVGRGYITCIPNPKGSTVRYLLESQRWDVSGGQRGRRMRPGGPLGGGHVVRQNQYLNQKMNQARPASRSTHRIDEETMKVLGRIELEMAKRNGGESQDA